MVGNHMMSLLNSRIFPNLFDCKESQTGLMMVPKQMNSYFFFTSLITAFASFCSFSPPIPNRYFLNASIAVAICEGKDDGAYMHGYNEAQ